MRGTTPGRLRSRAWFDHSANIDMTALYLERDLNFGLSLEELRSGRPIIAIAQTGSDPSPCRGRLASGAILEGSEKFRRIAPTSGLPRDNH